jgi:hypothetical protein
VGCVALNDTANAYLGEGRHKIATVFWKNKRRKIVILIRGMIERGMVLEFLVSVGLPCSS